MILPILLSIAATTQDTIRISLSEAVGAAVRSYPAVAIAQAQQERADADVATARSSLLPHAQMDVSLTRYQEPMIVYPLHSLNLTAPPAFDRTLVQPGLSVGYTLYDFGARRAQITAADAQREAAATSVDATEQAVVSRAVGAFVRVLADRDRIRADDQDLAALQSEADRARKRFAVGKAAQVEVLRAQAALQRAGADRVSSVADLDVAEHELAAVTGLPFLSIHTARLATLRLTDTTWAADTVGASRAALVARALINNPDAVLAQRRAAAAAATADAARAMALPQIQASGAYLSPGSINGNFHPDWQVGIQMSYALFTGGAATSAVHAADADARAASGAVRLAQLTAADAVDHALASLRGALARTAALETAEAQLAEVVRIEALARDVGEGTQTDYLTVAADLLRTRVTLIDSRYAELLARIELARLTGELSPDWLARNVESIP